MNQELQKQLAAMLGKLVDVSADATTWAGQQIPPLVQEKITYGRISETVTVLLSVVVIAVVYRLAQRTFRMMKEGSDLSAEEVGGAVLSVACLIGGIIASVQLCFSLQACLMAWFAPRLYIVEWLHELVKG